MQKLRIDDKPNHCRYQVCAFCYQRLQLENNKQCPGCRTVYGAEAETSEGKQLAGYNLKQVAASLSQNKAGKYASDVQGIRTPRAVIK